MKFMLIEEQTAIVVILRPWGFFEGPAGPSGPSPPAPFRLEYTSEPFYDDVPFGPGDTFAA